MNCPNCGAPIGGDKCEYCGYTLLNIIDFEPGKVCGVKMRYRGKEFTARMRVGDMSVDVEYGETADRMLGDEGRIMRIKLEPTLRVNLELVSV